VPLRKFFEKSSLGFFKVESGRTAIGSRPLSFLFKMFAPHILYRTNLSIAPQLSLLLWEKVARRKERRMRSKENPRRGICEAARPVGDEAASQIGKNKEYWVGATAYTPKTTMFLTGRPFPRF